MGEIVSIGVIFWLVLIAQVITIIVMGYVSTTGQGLYYFRIQTPSPVPDRTRRYPDSVPGA